MIDRSTGERLGQVQRFLVDPQTRAVVALLLAEPAHGRPGLVVPLDLVSSFGEDAIMLDGRPPLVEAEALAAMPAWGLAPNYPLGLPLLSASGEKLGRIADYRFNFQNGRLEELLLRERFWADLFRGSRRLPASAVAVFGPDALILVDNVREFRRTPS